MPYTTVDIKIGRSAKKSDRKMLKAGDLARWEDHRVREVKIGKPDEIGGYHMYEYFRLKRRDLSSVFHRTKGPRLVNYFPDLVVYY